MSWEWTRAGCYAELVRRLQKVDEGWWGKVWEARAARWPALGDTLRRTECISQAGGPDLLELYKAEYHRIVGRRLSDRLTAEMVDRDRGPLFDGKGGEQKLSRFLCQMSCYDCGIDPNSERGQKEGPKFAGQITDAVRAHNGAFVTLSANPLDVLDASNYANWTSCHRWWGDNQSFDCREHAAGPFAYLPCPTVLIAFSHREDYPANKSHKSWRQMIWVNEQGDVAVLGRQYGVALSENRHSLVRKMVAELLANESAPERMHFQSGSVSFQQRAGDGGPYVGDAITGAIRVGERRKEPPSVTHTVPATECPSCGKTRKVSPAWVQCGQCGGQDKDSFRPRCGDCQEYGEGLNSPQHATDCGWRRLSNVWHCPDCLENNYSQCENCGRHLHNESDDAVQEAVHVTSTGGREEYYYCRPCLIGGGWSECVVCDEWVSQGNRREHEGGYYHEECLPEPEEEPVEEQAQDRPPPPVREVRDGNRILRDLERAMTNNDWTVPSRQWVQADNLADEE